jgi:S-formylglutathione hydrolase FrmB
LHGFPGRPSNWLDLVRIGPALDSEIRAQRMPPVVAVMPTCSTYASTECVNAVSGEQNETYLTADVPQDVTASLRVLPDRAWGIAGYSTGGFCATNLGFRHPSRYVAIVSISGYFHAGEDPGSRPLYGRGTALLAANSPVLWIRRHSPTEPPLYLVSSLGDPGSVVEMQNMLSAADSAHLGRLITPLVTRGGHNGHTWAAAMPAALDWLGRYLPAPIAPPLQEAPIPEHAHPSQVAAAGVAH